MATNDHEPWGRADETGTVFVREAGGERAVGQYPDGTAEEALAYFERKYVELAGQVTLLEQRVKRGTASADVARTIEGLKTTISTGFHPSAISPPRARPGTRIRGTCT